MKLPLNCEVEYFNDFLNQEEATGLYRLMIDEYKIHQSLVKMEVAGEIQTIDLFKMTFVTADTLKMNDGTLRHFYNPQVWSMPFLKVKERIERLTGRVFDVGVCIFYRNGNDGVPFHFDPPAFGDTSVIPSLSLGEEREFQLRENTTQKIHSVILEHGSLVIMGKGCQAHYQHAIPFDEKYKNGRVNITFRQFGYGNNKN